MKPKISFEKAKRLSIFKWELLAKGMPIEEIYKFPELENIECACGFCERWSMCCLYCEFGKVAGMCSEEGSMYNEFYNSNIPIPYAKKILNVIKNLKPNTKQK